MEVLYFLPERKRKPAPTRLADTHIDSHSLPSHQSVAESHGSARDST